MEVKLYDVLRNETTLLSQGYKTYRYTLVDVIKNNAAIIDI